MRSQYVLRDDPVLAALAGLERALEENAERARMMQERIEHIREQRENGVPYSEIVPNEKPPLIVQLVTENAAALDRFGVQLRRLEARALYDEGLTMEKIAVLFGVTRQRVSTLLKASSG